MRNRITAAIAILAGVIILGLLAYSYVLGNKLETSRAQTVAERKAHETTVANYRRARAEAERADAENRARVEAEQRAANERISNEYEARIAAVREHYDRLMRERAGAGGGGAGRPPVPPGGAAPSRPDGAAGDNGLSLRERLVASETAIRLEELQRWVRGMLETVNRQPSAPLE